MESYYVDWNLDSSITNFNDRFADMMENTIVDKLDDCGNLTYLGMASSGNYREAVFQILDCENLYLRIGKNDRSDFYTTSGYPFFRLSTSASLSTCNSYITTNISYGGTPNFLQTNNSNVKFNFYMVTDGTQDNNLRAIWQCKSPNSSITQSQGIILGQTDSERDFVGVMGQGANQIAIIYLDDSTNTAYRVIPDTSLSYAISGKVLKKNWWPVTTDNSLLNTVDNLGSDFTRIYCAELDSLENSGTNKDSASIRKLIQIDNTYYRQIVANYWVVDPNGDETPVTITNIS